MTILAAGAVLWRPADGGTVEVAVVHRPHHADWSLPKGKVDPGETLADTAVRELAEETGFAAVLGRHLRTVEYTVADEDKSVDYWAARAGEGRFTPGDETDELRWLTPGEAAALLTYASDRTVLDDFTARPAALRSMLLVRHAVAGRRSEWSGPDADRPLDEEGREQARALVPMLGRYGVTALRAVPNVRCRQTLEPYAEATGIPVAPLAELGDEAVWDDPGAALAAVDALVAGSGTTAVCAQGDGIPRVVRALATRSRAAGSAPLANRELDEPPSRKGSFWVLSFAAGGVLAAADYHRDPTA
ncbi:NUDIX hydrolase [Actinomycetospora sp. NBRC 106375]|uniref:NUDIX hydrolase n=1 Tax=Actinomycetospora sp. NBRC 106375 TaxID=3032207 RepID=UPI0024A1E9AF|nr:NUDIX hydrolase [Actinomycetospora sp. NBRC 106375]